MSLRFQSVKLLQKRNTSKESRLSTTTYSPGDDAKPTRVSGASNPDLLKHLQADIGKLKHAGIGQQLRLIIYLHLSVFLLRSPVFALD